MEKVPSTTKWHFETRQPCLVRMQIVVDANVELVPWGEDNKFRSNLDGDIVNEYKEKVPKIPEEDHSVPCWR